MDTDINLQMADGHYDFIQFRHISEMYQLDHMNADGTASRTEYRERDISDNQSHEHFLLNQAVYAKPQHSGTQQHHYSLANKTPQMKPLLDKGIDYLQSFADTCREHNPLTADGRKLVRNRILSSGPVYQSVNRNNDHDNRLARFTGWRMGALMASLLLTICLILETIMFITALVMDHKGRDGPGNGIVYSGSCQTTRYWSISISLLINLFATVTIGCSNYIMQCLNAPSRAEVDNAHRNGYWVRIGVSSLSNLRHVSQRKQILWWAMSLSSLPVHLLFNSAFFASLQTNNYAVMIVGSDYESTDLWQDCHSENSTDWSDLACEIYQTSKSSQYERLDSPRACMQRYANTIVSDYGNVLLVSTQKSADRGDVLRTIWSNDVSTQNAIFWLTNGSSFPVGEAFSPDPENSEWASLGRLEALFGMFLSYEYSQRARAIDQNFGKWVVTTENVTKLVAEISDPGSGKSISRVGNNLQAFLDKVTVTIEDASFDNGRMNSTSGWPHRSGYQVQFVDGGNSPAQLSEDINHKGRLNGTADRNDGPKYHPTGWLCHDNSSSPCTLETALSHESDWRVTPFGIPVSHCYSQKTPTQACELRYSSIILIVVIVCEVIKIIVVVCAIRIKNSPLVTVGDAIASFIQQPDEVVYDQCLLDKQEVRARMAKAQLEWTEYFWPIDFSKEKEANRMVHHLARRSIQVWTPRAVRWRHAVSRTGWVMIHIAIALAITACALTLNSALTITIGGRIPRSDIWKTGLSADPNSIFEPIASASTDEGSLSTDQFIQQVLVINSPQLFFSLMYFVYNSTFTTMHASEEWSGFAKSRKALRVTSPAAGQRSTYWLSLPWTYSLPLIATSALLHWLVSRSLYLVYIKLIGPDGKVQPDQAIFACGFSSLMMVFVLIIVSLLLLTIWILSRRKLYAGIPFIGNCSLAIAAVCHHPNNPTTEAQKPLLWGVTEKATMDRPGHCSLSSESVDRPVPCMQYA